MPIDDYSSDAPDAPPLNSSAPAPGKYIKISVPDFMNTGSPTGMGSYLRLGAVEDLTKAGKAAGSVGLVVDMGGNPLVADLNTPINPSYDPYAPWGPNNTPADPSSTPPAPATTPGLPAPPPQSPANASAAGPDPSGEDLASLVQGFVDDTRNRGVWTGTPGGQNKDPGYTAQGPLYGYPWVTPVTDAKAPGQLDAGDISTTSTPKYTASSKPVFFPEDYRTLESSQLHTKGGWRDHSDGNRITTTRGDKVEVIRGNYKLIVLGRQDQTKAKYAGMDISGGQNVGDLTADASTDFNQGSTAYSSLFEWRQCTTEANAGAKAAKAPVDTAAALLAAQQAAAAADAAQATATALQAQAAAAATAATAAAAAAAATENPAAIAAAVAAQNAATAAAANAANAQAQAQEATAAANTSAAAATAATAAASAAVAAAAKAQATANAAAANAAANPSPQSQAAATAAASANQKAQALVGTTAAAATKAQQQAGPAAAAAAAATAKAQAAQTAAATAAANAAAAQQAATATANAVTQQEAVAAQALAANLAAQAAAAQIQADLAVGQANAAAGKLEIVSAGLDASPLEQLKLWEDDGANPDFRSVGSTKSGSGPKVQVKYQKVPADPSLRQDPDGVTFAQPISMGVSIKETWSYQIYNYQGIGYYPATPPAPWPPPPPKTQTWSLDGKTPIDPPDRAPPPPDFPTVPEWVIYPVSKVVGKTYTWKQSTETFVDQTVTVTAGPRLDPVIADPSAPARTYPADALGAKLYDRDLLKAVLLPGAGPGAYNKIAHTWTETHVNESKTWLRANDTYTNNEVLGTTHTVNNYGTSITETTVGTQSTTLNAGTTSSDTTVGSSVSNTTVGSQVTSLVAGSTFATSLVGTKTTMDVVGLSTALSLTGIKTAISVTGVDLSIAISGLKLALSIGPHQSWTIPKEEIIKVEVKQTVFNTESLLVGLIKTVIAGKYISLK